jgi:hypothetical protein
MNIIKKDKKVYILFTNAERVNESYCKYRDIGTKPTKGSPIWLQGSQGAFLFNVDEIHHVSRVLPYDTTARHYWGEFRRSYKMIPRLSDMVHLDEDYLLECSFLENLSQEDFEEHTRGSYEFNSYALAKYDRHSFHGVHSGKENRQKTWNLTSDRFLGPNIKDYSINNCYKYYTLI